MGKKLTVKKRTLVDEGIYAAKVKSIEEKEGKYGDYYMFNFKITKGEYADKIVNGNAPGVIEVGNKLHKWANVLLGKVLDADEEFDIDDLIGGHCKIAVEHNVTDDGTYAKVNTIYKAKGGDEDEEEEEEPKKKHRDEEEEEEEPKKKKHHDEEEEEDEPKKKKHHDEEEEEDEPKKKKHTLDEEEDDEPKKKKHHDEEDPEFD